MRHFGDIQWFLLAVRTGVGTSSSVSGCSMTIRAFPNVAQAQPRVLHQTPAN